MYDAARFSPSGDKIAYLGIDLQYAGATLDDLFVFDVNTNERTCLSTEWDFLPRDAMISDTRYGESDIGPIWSKNEDRKSTRLNSSHVSISYAVFCLKKK